MFSNHMDTKKIRMIRTRSILYILYFKNIYFKILMYTSSKYKLLNRFLTIIFYTWYSKYKGPCTYYFFSAVNLKFF